jgi:hypothetical protein
VKSLDARVRNLEGRFIGHVAPGCASCGLRHVQPLTIAMARKAIGFTDDGEPVPPLCLCPCCADGRWIAELTHGRESW